MRSLFCCNTCWNTFLKGDRNARYQWTILNDAIKHIYETSHEVELIEEQLEDEE